MNAVLFICRYFQETGEEAKATDHKARRPLTPQAKGGMTVPVATETAHGIHLGPATRVLHLRPQEMLVNGASLILQGPMELEPAWRLAHPSLHSKRGFHSANRGPLRLKLWTLEGNSSWRLSLLSHLVQSSNWALGNVYLDITKRNLFVSHWAILNIFTFSSCYFLRESHFSLVFPSDRDWPGWSFSPGMRTIMIGFPKGKQPLAQCACLPAARRGCLRGRVTLLVCHLSIWSWRHRSARFPLSVG